MTDEAQIIYDALGGGRKSVYCPTCRGGDNCEDCHRKMMGWKISEGYAEKIAKRISEL